MSVLAVASFCVLGMCVFVDLFSVVSAVSCLEKLVSRMT